MPAAAKLDDARDRAEIDRAVRFAPSGSGHELAARELGDRRATRRVELAELVAAPLLVRPCSKLAAMSAAELASTSARDHLDFAAVSPPRAGVVAMLLGALSLGGCRRGVEPHGALQDAAPQDAAPPAVDRFVVFDTRAALCRAATLDEASCLRQAPTFQWARTEGIGRLVEDRGTSVLVETTDPWQVGAHCASASNLVLTQLGLRLRFFLARSSLFPVTEQQTLAFSNRTDVTLRPGTPLLPPERGVSADLVTVDPGGFPLLLARASLRSSDSYVETAPIVESAQPTRVRGGRAMRYGVPLPTADFAADPDNESVASSLPAAPGVLRHPFHEPLVYTQAPHEAGLLVELRSSCAVLHAVVAPDALEPAPRTRFVDGAVAQLNWRHERRSGRFRVRANAPLFFEDGSPAGRVGSLTVPFNGEERSAPGRVCVQRTLFGGRVPPRSTPADAARATFTLCVDEKDAVLWPRFWTDADAAKIGATTKTYVVVEVDNRSELGSALVTREVHRALRDALLVVEGFAMAPPGQTLDQARAAAGARGVGVARVVVTVGAADNGRPGAIFVHRRVEATISRADGSTSNVPDLAGGMSPGADDIVGGKPTQAFLDQAFARALEQESIAIRTVMMAGDKPPSTQEIASVEDLPPWALPLGFSKP